VIERPGTWGEVEAGTTLLSPTDLPLLIVLTKADAQGRVWYQAHDHIKRNITIQPKPADAPVTLLEMTPEEAEAVATRGLGAERVLDWEREARMPERAKRWVIPVLATSGKYALNQARDHLSWYHSTYSGSAEAGGFKTLKQILKAHQEMHEECFMDKPHTHKEK
jgi:hypothetical protein